MRNRILAGTAFAALILLGAASPVSAEPAAKARQGGRVPGPVPAAGGNCSIATKSGVGSVAVREAPDDTSQLMGYLTAGTSYPAACDLTTNWVPTEYNLCGGKSVWWVAIPWYSEMGFVPLQCVTFSQN